jgi:hypothetical protein
LKLKLVALTLIALACWLVPIKVLAQETGTQTYAQARTQTVSEIHDPGATQTANSDTSERGKENEAGAKETKQVIKQDNGSYSGRYYSKEEVTELIKNYSAQYGISADLPLSVANCESGYNQFSKNKSSTASGVFQYIHSTWIHTEAGKQGISVFDADANVHMAIKSIASGGISNWSASKSCWHN